MSIGTRVKEDFSLLAILIIPIAIAVNFVGGSLALALKLPLYLDSIGTFLVAMLAGPLVGAIAGFLSLLFVSATDPTSLPWAVLATLVGGFVGWLARRRMFTTAPRIASSIVMIILISVACVVTIRLLVFGGYTTTGSSVIAAALVAAGVPMIPAQIVSSLSAETPDKTLSVLLALLVIRSMSDRYLIKFSNGHLFTGHARSQRRSGRTATPAGAAVATPAASVAEHHGLQPLDGPTRYGSYDRWRGTRSAAVAEGGIAR